MKKNRIKPLEISWKFVGDEQEAQRRLAQVYDRIFTIAIQNLKQKSDNSRNNDS